VFVERTQPRHAQISSTMTLPRCTLMPHSNLLQFNLTNRSCFNKPPHTPLLHSENSMSSSPPFGHSAVFPGESVAVEMTAGESILDPVRKDDDMRQTCSHVLGRFEPRSWWKLTIGEIEKGRGGMFLLQLDFNPPCASPTESRFVQT
jgi:hypothetical protein